MADKFFRSVLRTTVGKKYLVAIGGLLFFLFLFFHLAGNLVILTGQADKFNAYSHFLVSLGGLLYIAEIILLAAFLLHSTIAVIVTLMNNAARPDGYRMVKSAGPPSHKTISSKTMIWTGIVVLVFVVFHVITFKYGPGMAQGYIATVHGEKMRDLYRLVIEVFKNKWFVIWYAIAMIFLGFHLRHAFWSSFQSLGFNNARWTPFLYRLGVTLAILLSAGFLIIPLWVYFIY